MSYKIPNEKECCDFLTEANGGTNALANSLKTASAYNQDKLLTESRRSGLALILYNLSSPGSYRLLTRNHLLAPKCGWDATIVGGYATGSGNTYYKGNKTTTINYSPGSSPSSSSFYFLSSYFIMDSPTTERTISLYQTSTTLTVTNQHPNLISVKVMPTSISHKYQVELYYNKWSSTDTNRYSISIPCGIPGCSPLLLQYQLIQNSSSHTLYVNITWAGSQITFTGNYTVGVAIYLMNNGGTLFTGGISFEYGRPISSLVSGMKAIGDISNTVSTSVAITKVRVVMAAHNDNTPRYDKTLNLHRTIYSNGQLFLSLYNDFMTQTQ